MTLLAVCDADLGADTDGSSSSGEAETVAPPSPCWTVGDGCLLALGDEQCGERMACVAVVAGVPHGVCVVPCSEASPCAVGKCDEVVGACMDDGAPATPAWCD